MTPDNTPELIRTILLVTHDKDVAKRGSRIITLADGQIIRSEKRGGTDA